MKKVEPNVPAATAPDSDALQNLFESAQGDGLRGTQVDELWSRVGPAVAPGPHGSGGAGATGAPSVATAGGGLVVKTLAVLAVGGGLVAGAYTHPWRASEPARPIVMVMATAQSPRSPEAVPPPDPAAAVDAVPPTVPVATLPPVASAPPRVGLKGRASWIAAVATGDGHTADRAPARQFPEQDLPSSGGVGSVGANVGMTSSSLASTPMAAAGSGGSPAMATNTGVTPLPSEGALLLRARQELASDPAGALALTDEHARRFPNGSGSLVPEREVLAIEALAALGRMPEARARLAAFRARYPQSAHLTRLDALVAR